MLSLSTTARIFVHAIPTDMRKSFDGLILIYRRLEQGCFQRPPHDSRNGMAIEIDATTLTLILSGVDLTTAKRRKRYRVERAASASE